MLRVKYGIACRYFGICRIVSNKVPLSHMKTTAKFALFLIVIIIVIIGFYKLSPKPAPVAVEVPVATSTTPEYTTYTAEKAGFEVNYPTSFIVHAIYPNAVTFETPDFSSPKNDFQNITTGSRITVVRDSAKNYKGYSNKQILADIAAGYSNRNAKDFEGAVYVKRAGYDSLEITHTFGENHNNHRVTMLLNNKQEFISVEQQYNFNATSSPYSKEFDEIVNSVKF